MVTASRTPSTSARRPCCPSLCRPAALILPNRFAITDEGPAFSTDGRGAGKKVSFTIHDTRGCSCAQIIDHLGLGEGHRRHGCSLGVMRSFIERLPEVGKDRRGRASRSS